MPSNYPTVEERLAALSATGLKPTLAELRFVDDMRRAREHGVGYGWMQYAIEWEWQAVTDGHGWGPASLTQQLEKTAALVRRMAKLLKDREWRPGKHKDDGAPFVDCESCDTRSYATDEGVHEPDCKLAAALRDAGVDADVEGGG